MFAALVYICGFVLNVELQHALRVEIGSVSECRYLCCVSKSGVRTILQVGQS